MFKLETIGVLMVVAMAIVVGVVLRSRMAYGADAAEPQKTGQ